MRQFENKVAVVAGGATGIGAASAERLASRGASVVVGDINAQEAEATASRIVEAGGTAIAFEFDLGEEPSVRALIQKAVDAYGGVDLLHANGAALHLTVPDIDVVEIDLEVWEETLRVNLRGYMLCMRHAIPRILERGGGAIVCTSSSAAVAAVKQMPAYAASKAGINALVRHVAARWGKQGIRCNGVSPGGLIWTPSAERNTRQEYLDRAEDWTMSPRAIGEPDDIAGAVAYLLSDDASWVNGQILSIGGSVV